MLVVVLLLLLAFAGRLGSSIAAVPHVAPTMTPEYASAMRRTFTGRQGLLLKGVLSHEQLARLSQSYLARRFGEELFTVMQHRYTLPEKRGQGRMEGHFGMVPVCENHMSLARFLRVHERRRSHLMSRQCPAHEESDMYQAKLMFDADDATALERHVLSLVEGPAAALFNRQTTGLAGFLLTEIKLLVQPGRYFFPFHYDCFERFVVQLDGNKTLHMVHNDPTRPEESLHEQGVFLPEDLAQPERVRSMQLGPGDMLYIPAHQFHMVEVPERAVTLVLSYNREDTSDWWGEMITRCEADFTADYPVQADRNVFEFSKLHTVS